MNHSLARAVQWALEAGYRHVDTAALYRVEDEVGLGVSDYLRDKSVHRENVYITTKVSSEHVFGKLHCSCRVEARFGSIETVIVDFVSRVSLFVYIAVFEL